MAKISGFRTCVVERKAYIQMRTSYGEGAATRPHLIVQLFAGDAWGVGEASPLTDFTGETAASAQVVAEHELLPLLMGRDPAQLAGIHAAMDREVPAQPSAKAAIDAALLDLAGKLAGVPACHLLGGPTRSELAFARPIGISGTSEAVATARSYVERGVGTVKMKVGTDLVTDIERVRAVREAVGPKVNIRIDGNQGMSFPQAHRLFTALADCNLLYCEQPLPAWDVEGAAALRRETGMRIAADEGVMNLRDAVNQIQHRAADAFILKMVKMGGAWRARQIASLAEAYGLGCVVVSTFDTQLGAAVCVQLARSLPNAPYAHEVTVFSTQPEMARTCHRVEGGMLIPGDDPGLGVASTVELEAILAGGS